MDCSGGGRYIYTAVRAAYDSGVGLLRPMYYSHPEADEAYDHKATQYMFGEDMLIAPITEAASAPVNGSISKEVWLPEGSWTDWHGERTFVGPMLHSAEYSQRDVPVFVKAGAVVPMKTMVSATRAALVPAVSKEVSRCCCCSAELSRRRLAGCDRVGALSWRAVE